VYEKRPVAERTLTDGGFTILEQMNVALEHVCPSEIDV
jgi:hypothetical protein